MAPTTRSATERAARAANRSVRPVHMRRARPAPLKVLADDDAFDTPHGTPLSTPWRSAWEAAQCALMCPRCGDCSLSLAKPLAGDPPIEPYEAGLCDACLRAPLFESSQLVIDHESPDRLACPAAADDPAVIRASWSQPDYNAYQTFAAMCTAYPGASDANRNQWRTVLNMPDAMWHMVRDGDPLRAQA